MRSHLICFNRDSYVAMRLSGISGVIAKNPQEAREALFEALQKPDIGILLITEQIHAWLPEEVRDLKLNHKFPLVVEIPDQAGATRRSDHYITDYINESVGIKI